MIKFLIILFSITNVDTGQVTTTNDRKTHTEQDEHWCHFLQLLDIIEYTLSPTVHTYVPAYLAFLIKDNLETYNEASFIPKMHYLVHVPQYLERYNIWSVI